MENLVYQGIFSLVGALGFGILMQIRGKKLCFSALGGMIGWVIYMVLTPFCPEDAIAYFIASVVVSLYSQQMARLLKAPVVVFLAVAFIPLVPGYTSYVTMEGLLLSDIPQFTDAAIYTFKVVMSIATGFLVSSNILQPTHPPKKEAV